MHFTPQWLPVHTPLRQVISVAHGSPSGSPHLPSALHSALRHSAARSQGWVLSSGGPVSEPFGSSSTHFLLVASQYALGSQSASVAQLGPHLPVFFGQMAERQ